MTAMARQRCFPKTRGVGAFARTIAALGFLMLPGQPLPAAQPIGVGVTAVGNCKFHTASAELDFGSLDPTAARDARAVAALTFKCTKSSVWTVSDDGGLHDAPAGSPRMKHTALAAFLPYRLTYTNATGTSRGANVTETLTVDGLIRGGDFATAPAGNYADTVTLTINP
jgi:spore coat protein U-like protein